MVKRSLDKPNEYGVIEDIFSSQMIWHLWPYDSDNSCLFSTFRFEFFMDF